MRNQIGAIGIRYKDQREDVADQHLVAVLERLTMSLTIIHRVI